MLTCSIAYAFFYFLNCLKILGFAENHEIIEIYYLVWYKPLGVVRLLISELNETCLILFTAEVQVKFLLEYYDFSIVFNLARQKKERIFDIWMRCIRLIHWSYGDRFSVWKLANTRNLFDLQALQCIIDLHLFQSALVDVLILTPCRGKNEKKREIALTICFARVYAWKNKMHKRLWCISLQLICLI